MPIDIAFLRGTSADETGNITMEREALVLDHLAQAMAARNSGGLVIVQVERIVAANSLSPRDVIVPSALVDAVVVASPEHHVQTYATDYSHAFSGRFRAPKDTAEAMPLDIRKVIARRCAFELPINGVVNLGIGMPEGVAAVATEEGLLDHMTLTAEPGVIGGQPASGLDFGAAVNTDAIIAQGAQFDFYDGGGLDLTCLGMAQADANGNVNVSRFGTRLAGAGGFINISQNAKKVVFAGTFTAGGLKVSVGGGKLETVEQITFAGQRAAAAQKPVLYVTERCVFELTERGMALTEVAPGIDVERDILMQMGFVPLIEETTEMDPRLFSDIPMGLQVDLLHLDLNDRIALNPETNQLFVNFEKMRVRAGADIALIKARVEAACGSLPDRVDVVVNYDGARIDDDIVEAYAAMVKELESRFYNKVSRYASSAFMRMKLGRAFQDRAAPNVFETQDEARGFLTSGT
jgi:propionate CoA-transferase